MPDSRISWSSGSHFEHIAGNCRIVRLRDSIFVSGTTGFDYKEMKISDDVVQQTHQTLANIDTALGHVGASFNDVTRVFWMITDRSYYEIAAPVIRQYITVDFVATTIVCDLVDDRIKVEIEVTIDLPQA